METNWNAQEFTLYLNAIFSYLNTFHLGISRKHTFLPFRPDWRKEPCSKKNILFRDVTLFSSSASWYKRQRLDVTFLSIYCIVALVGKSACQSAERCAEGQIVDILKHTTTLIDFRPTRDLTSEWE